MYRNKADRRRAEHKYRKSAKGKATISARAKLRRNTDASYRGLSISRTKEWRTRNPDYARKWKRANKVKVLLYLARARAKAKNLPCTITEADISVVRVCPYLGIKLSYSRAKRENNSASLDRIDSKKGYVPGNVEVISWRANHLKNTATLRELVLMGRAAAKKLSRG